MDLLVEKLDGSRYYLSQYKVLVTAFDESAPTVERNSTQLDQRNGSIDFGGWHKSKTINLTGYYRADDQDEEETLREKLFALFSDPDGYYITQLKTDTKPSFERPGESSESYYDKLDNYPSHKRFLVYTEAPELEFMGNVNGSLLYKLTIEFTTLKLPYGETPKQDVTVPGAYADLPENLVPNTSDSATEAVIKAGSWSPDGLGEIDTVVGKTYVYHSYITNSETDLAAVIDYHNSSHTWISSVVGNTIKAGQSGYSVVVFTVPEGAAYLMPIPTRVAQGPQDSDKKVSWKEEKLEEAIPNPQYVGLPTNLLKSTSEPLVIDDTVNNQGWAFATLYDSLDTGQKYTFSADVEVLAGDPKQIRLAGFNGNDTSPNIDIDIKDDHIVGTLTATDKYNQLIIYAGTAGTTKGNKVKFNKRKLENGDTASSWSPSPDDSDYYQVSKWSPSPKDGQYYVLNGGVSVPYSGSVPCNQLEQGFTLEFTAKGAADNLEFSIDDTKLTYSDKVAAGDVFKFSGFSYTQNGLSIVSKTNKAYFTLKPNKPNLIISSVPGSIRVLGLQNLYA